MLAGAGAPQSAGHGRLLYRHGAEICRDAGLLAMARGADPEAWRALTKAATQWVPVAFPLQGRDLLRAGMTPGPRIGQVLGEVEEWWIGREFGRPDRDACLERALAAAGEGNPL